MNKRQKEALEHPDRLGEGAKKRRKLPLKERAAPIVEEFKQGTLYSGSGHQVTKPSQMRAIIHSETTPKNGWLQRHKSKRRKER
jgi:hypothetical protein